ncbi:MAG TPA: DUF2304 family protein [Candidatus Absconditabacterales bacterium]|nr:DUF2304 family protein [Candidatus Absconditabacterales bacterium]
MNILHFLVFVLGSGSIILFAINNELLNSFGRFFGLTRGADLIVYGSLVVLAYFYVTLLNSHTKDKQELTRFISQLAINKAYDESKEKIKNFKNKIEKDKFIFNIRAYNEGKVIGKVIDEIVAEGFKKMVFVDDGSKDNTLEILEQKKKQHKNCLFVIISHTINRGGGAANQSGYKFIQTHAKELNVDRFVGFDADGQMDIKDMDKFISEIEKDNGKYNAYLGSRFIKGGVAKNIPPMRKVILSISRLVTILFYKTNISDPHNGYRVVDIESFKRIQLNSDGMHYANEFNEQIRKHKLKFKEVPVNIRYTDYSLQKGQKNSNSIKLAMEMIYKKIFFR